MKRHSGEAITRTRALKMDGNNSRHSKGVFSRVFQANSKGGENTVFDNGFSE